jgi:hypothetical protein
MGGSTPATIATAGPWTRQGRSAIPSSRRSGRLSFRSVSIAFPPSSEPPRRFKSSPGPSIADSSGLRPSGLWQQFERKGKRAARRESSTGQPVGLLAFSNQPFPSLPVLTWVAGFDLAGSKAYRRPSLAGIFSLEMQRGGFLRASSNSTHRVLSHGRGGRPLQRPSR